MAVLGAGKLSKPLHLRGGSLARVLSDPSDWRERERNITALRFPNYSGTEIARFGPDLNRAEATMLELTANAVSAFKRAIGLDQGEVKGVRITLVPSGCAELKFKLDLVPAAAGGDTVFETQGVALFVHQKATGLIKGTRIDYAESLQGGAFIFQNPNAESTCVCGKSFTPSR